MYRSLTVLLMMMWTLPGTQASDLDRESRLRAEIEDSIMDGEPVELEANGHRFLGIYTQTDLDGPRGGVLILHGRGYHPDWQEVVYPLRTALPERGWNTLSIQLPVLGKQAKYYDYVPVFPESWPRIQAGIEYLRGQGSDYIVLIAHSCGAHMALSWIRQHGDGDIDAFIGIGMGATDYRQPLREPFPLDTMRVPVLDIYGGDEYPAVIRMAPGRSAMLGAGGNPKSRQVVVPGADHYFHDMSEPLVEEVLKWLGEVRGDPERGR